MRPEAFFGHEPRRRSLAISYGEIMNFRKVSVLSALFGFAAFSMSAQAGIISLSGFNKDLVAEKEAANPAVSTSAAICCGWIPYENGAPHTNPNLGLPSNGVVTSSQAGHHQFQLTNYNTNNALVVRNGNSATLNLVAPTSLSEIYILGISQGNVGHNWNVRLNFSDASSHVFDAVYSPDWTVKSSDTAFSEMGLIQRGSWTSTLFWNPVYMFENDFTLPVAFQSKSVVSLTFTTMTGNDGSMNFLAASSSSYAPVPEPASWSLMGMGLVGTLAARRRNRRNPV